MSRVYGPALLFSLQFLESSGRGLYEQTRCGVGEKNKEQEGLVLFRNVTKPHSLTRSDVGHVMPLSLCCDSFPETAC